MMAKSVTPIFNIDYDKSILSISNSLLKHYGVAPYHKTLKILDEKLKRNPKNVILMVLDGMGLDLIERILPKNSFIRRHITTELSSVFPPTTTAAMTAYNSGLSPWESGYIGWMCYWQQHNEFIETFTNEAFYSGKKLETLSPMDTFLKYETIYEKITKKNPNLEFNLVFPRIDSKIPYFIAKKGEKTFQKMCSKIIKLANKNDNQKLIFAYWSEPDSSIHRLGTTAPKIKQILSDFDSNIERIYKEIKDSLIIISADHGETDVKELYLNDFPSICKMLIRPYGLEPRFLTFFVKKEKIKDFPKEFNKFFAKNYKLFTKKEFMESGLLGSGKMHPQIPKFLGDFVAIATGDIHLRYSTGEKIFSVLKGNHAGFTPAEMRVPLILLETR